VAVADAQSATVTLTPQRCVTITETPVTTTEVTDKTSRWTNSLGFLAAAGAWAALGALSWSSAPDNPDKCPMEDKDCRTKADARGAAYVCWGLGAGFAGYGVYAGIPKTKSERGKSVESVDRQTSPARACSQGIGNVAVELRLPSGKQLKATTDEQGVARFSFVGGALDGLTRSAVASVWISGKQSGELELSKAVAELQRKSGRTLLAVASSPALGASGNLSSSAAKVEVMLSPQAGDGSFLGDLLTRSDVTFERVTATPAQGGDAIPMQLEVTRLDASVPRVTGQSAIVVFDSSGSMKSNDPGRSGRLRAADAFLQGLKPEVDVALLDFGMGSSDGLHVSRVLTNFTSERAALREGLTKLGESGGTPLYESLGDALTLFERSGRSGAVLLLTDGQANRIDSVTKRAIAAGVPVYPVGLGQQLDFGNLRQLGLDTGGFFIEASEREALQKAFAGIAMGVSLGRVRVFGQGAPSAELRPGAYRVRGDVIVKGPDGASRTATPFEMMGRVTSR
jgi:hypothetical protein